MLAWEPPQESVKITNPLLPTTLQNTTGSEFISAYIPKVITLILIVGMVAFLFMLIIGGVQWIASGGDKAAVEAARNRLTAAIVGVVVLVSVFAFVLFLESFFGINILTIDISTLFLSN